MTGLLALLVAPFLGGATRGGARGASALPGSSRAPTPAPTAAPTVAPTAAPTPAPTPDQSEQYELLGSDFGDANQKFTGWAMDALGRLLGTPSTAARPVLVGGSDSAASCVRVPRLTRATCPLGAELRILLFHGYFQVLF